MKEIKKKIQNFSVKDTREIKEKSQNKRGFLLRLLASLYFGQHVSKRSPTDLQALTSYRVLYHVHVRSKTKTRSNSVSGSACFVLHYFVKKDSCKGRKSLNIKYATVFVFVVWFIRVLASLNLCLSQISG